jgi:hypothetical protein
MIDITLALVGSAITVLAGFTWYKLSRLNVLRDRAQDEKKKQDDKMADRVLAHVNGLKKHKEFLISTKNEFDSNFIVHTIESRNPRDHLISRLVPIKAGISSLTVFAEQDAPKLIEELSLLTKYVKEVETYMSDAITRRECGQHNFDLGELRGAVWNCSQKCHSLKVDIDSLLLKSRA